MSDLETLLREYADVADAGCKTHWANAMRSAAVELAALRSDIERHVQAAADLANEVAELRAENERLREDAERWKTAMRLLVGVSTHGYTFKVPAPSLSRWDWQEQFTAAIDAARKEGK